MISERAGTGAGLAMTVGTSYMPLEANTHWERPFAFITIKSHSAVRNKSSQYSTEFELEVNIR